MTDNFDVFSVGQGYMPHGSQEHNEMAILARELFFSNELGKRFWTLLRKRFIESPVAPLGQPASFARFREGQNSVIRLIEQDVEFLNKNEVE